MNVLAEEHLQTEEASPFLPGTKLQYAWDSTSLGWLKTCPRLYQYHMIEGWRSKTESIHLRFGIEYHKALETYDILRAAGLEHHEAARGMLREVLIRTADFAPSEEQYGKPAKYKNRYSLVRAVLWYVDKFNSEQDPAETVYLSDGKPAVELSFKIELDWGPDLQPKMVVTDIPYEPDLRPGAINIVDPESGNKMEYIPSSQPYLLCGHLDRVVKYNDDLYGLDRKTSTSQLGDFYFEQYSPHNQMTLYALAGKVIMNAPVKGVIIDGAQLLIDEARFKRGFTFRNNDQIEEWLLDLRYWLTVAEGYAEQEYWPKNDTSCNHYSSPNGPSFGGCPFRDVCNKPERLRESLLKSNFVREPWNPLIPR